MRQPIIAMTTATGMGPLPCILERRVGTRAVDQTFKAAGLPLDLLENRNQKIPMAAMISLFREAEKVAGDEILGLRVGREMKPGAYGLWTKYSGQGRTARDALTRLSQTIGVHQSGGQMRLRQSDKQFEWSYIVPSSFKANIRAHAEHVIPVMIGFLRPYFGPSWLPDRIGVPYPNDGLSARRSDLLPVDWCYLTDAVTLSFPAEMLKSTLSSTVHKTVYTQVELYAERALRETQSLDNVVREIVALRLMDGNIDIDGAARLVGQSLRTFQRNLDREGSSYTELLTQVRKQRATALLLESDLSIMDIGFQIGFSDPANFTRAFRSWTGANPSQIRKNSGNS
ncbi:MULTISPECIES: AraC family transcriptional regulator [unclassified Ruegeria]|uniref:AraC family transcriptional regulator n=1 Tax=unclassified Ruegeria TaxID=2625375 RepID=UPI001ADB9818|nr:MULTISPECIES: AraC family transcriptional regulator [unclassified Ruegeria]MBO9411097.1 AraC family transcriptional regulator ligand-binding domain-containing protein [Ruegeria sp. R8_1]MBO9415298.1 AraC family transcriptional regulator ligand-binding domain-containing protein [Ruegeria sp. R8_2]